ncbi:MAG: M48 family metalloprotease [Flavobacteriales bacterium]|nr:M48 family metalloprotease [Flavobacteriales bacterium]
MKNSIFKWGLGLLLIGALGQCKDDSGNTKVNLFTLEEDKEFGRQVAAEIDADRVNFPVLDSASYPVAYGHLNRITQTILNSGVVKYKDDFAWRVRIIEDDSTLNAFCTPGGYIYVYTGLIKYLDSEDQLAGVMGHEIAHADERHSTEALTKQYGTEVLFAILFGQDQGTLAQIAKGMISLKYSRTNETESDRRSVEYLYPTEYDARGAARFFEKLLSSGVSGGPEFLSTHPSPENRVEEIIAHWQELGGKVGETFESRYQEFKQSLP